MLQIYKSCVRPILEYGAVFLRNIPKRDALALDRIQYACIRVCLGSTKTTHTGSLEVMAGLSPLEIRRDVAILRFVNKRIGLAPWERQFATQHAIESSRSPLRDAVIRLREFFPWNHTLPNLPCFLVGSTVRSKCLSINFSIQAAMKQSTDLPANDLVQREMVKSYNGFSVCATDGSKSVDGTGYAVVNNFGAPCVSVKLPHNISVYMAELFAILDAVRLIKEAPMGKYVVMTDSMSALKSLQTQSVDSSTPMAWFEVKQAVRLAEFEGSELSFLWVPAHSGVIMNEEADELAKAACISGVEQPHRLTYFDVKYPAKQQGMHIWQNNWRDGTMGRFCHSILPTTSQLPWFVDSNLNRRQVVILSKLISNHSRLPAHLKRNRIIEDDSCSCGEAPCDPEHIIFGCTRFLNQRRTLWTMLIRKQIIPDLQVILREQDLEVLKTIADFIIACDVDI